MTETITKQSLQVALRCSSCGAPGSGSCQCGVGYVPAGEFAANMARERPELSSRELAEKSGVSQRTAARALRTAREPFGSAESVVVGRDGKRYPHARPKPEPPEPRRFYGGNDLQSAKDHIQEDMMGFQRALGPDDWEKLVAWIGSTKWAAETRH